VLDGVGAVVMMAETHHCTTISPSPLSVSYQTSTR
jgi:hypothetical protein